MPDLPPIMPLNNMSDSADSGLPFGYAQLRKAGLVLWVIVTLGFSIAALYFEIPPFDYLVTMPAFVDNVVVLNIVAALLAWLMVNAPFVLVWWVIRKIKYWFTHL